RASQCRQGGWETPASAWVAPTAARRSAALMSSRRFTSSGGQHDRQAFGPARGDGGDGAKLDLEHLLVQEEQSVEGLLLRGSGDVAVDGQVSEEGTDLGRPHVTGVASVVKEDELASPAEVTLLGIEGVVPGTQQVAHPVEQARRLWRPDGGGSR